MTINNHEDFYGEIRDPLLGDIKLFRYEFEIINSRPFQRLRGLCQLPGSEFVYPSMTHTRFSHSIGVLGIADKIVFASNLKLKLFDHQLLRIASLLHDIHEPPFYNAILHEDFITDEFKNSNRAKKIRQIFDECEKNGVKFPVKADDVIDILEGKKKKFLKSIIDCEVGANRLDYLQRDAYFCGVKYGYIDERILSSFELVKNQFVLKSEAIPIAEDIIHNLYQMKLSVYDHKVVRSVLTLVRDAFREIYRNHNIKLDEVFDMTDAELLLKLNLDLQRKLKYRKLPKLVYELNTFKLKDPTIVEDLGKKIREREKSLIQYIAKHSGLEPNDIRIEPVELRKVGYADPLDVIYRKKIWDPKDSSQKNYKLAPFKKSTRMISHWSEYFYEQWRVFIFCFVGESWNIEKIDNTRDTVRAACERVLGFLTRGEYDKTDLPEFQDLFQEQRKTEPKELGKKIFLLSQFSKRVLSTFDDQGPLTTEQIQKQLKCSRTTASLILNKLHKQNILVKTKKGRAVHYSLPQTVRDLLEEHGLIKPLMVQQK